MTSRSARRLKSPRSQPIVVSRIGITGIPKPRAKPISNMRLKFSVVTSATTHSAKRDDLQISQKISWPVAMQIPARLSSVQVRAGEVFLMLNELWTRLLAG